MKHIIESNESKETSGNAGLTMVSFCGQQFCADSIMELPPGLELQAEIADFTGIVQKLDVAAHAACDQNAKTSEPVLVSAPMSKSSFLVKGLRKLAQYTAWQINILPNDKGLDHGLKLVAVLPA